MTYPKCEESYGMKSLFSFPTSASSIIFFIIWFNWFILCSNILIFVCSFVLFYSLLDRIYQPKQMLMMTKNLWVFFLLQRHVVMPTMKELCHHIIGMPSMGTLSYDDVFTNFSFDFKSIDVQNGLMKILEIV